MKTYLHLTVLLILFIFCIKAFPGSRDFINHLDSNVQISVNGLACVDYPPKFEHCKIEENNKTVVQLKRGESIHLHFNHFLVGQIEVHDLDRHLLLDRQVLVDRKGNLTASLFNACYTVILIGIQDSELKYKFDGCVGKMNK